MEENMGWRQRLYIIIFESDTPKGKAFDVLLLIAILCSIFVVIVESVERVQQEYGMALRVLEWVFTILFSAEFILRIISARRPLRYVFSFYGIVDLLSIMPSYLSLFVTGGQYLLVIRGLRLLRVFRVLKLGRFLGEAEVLKLALQQSLYKIIVFIGVVLAGTIIVGATMYLVEGPEAGFTDIPISIYWAIVTITTVGYGDISPTTPMGQLLASALMIVGYGIIAVPTGIVSVELNKVEGKRKKTQIHVIKDCPQCGWDTHDEDANFCKKCGAGLEVRHIQHS